MGELLGVSGVENARDLHHPVQNLAVVDLDHIVAAGNADGLQGVRQHGANLRVGRDRSAANRVGVALIELPEPARPGLFVAPDRAHGVAAVGRGQVVAVLRRHPRQRRGQVVAQRQPVLILFLPGKDTLVRAVHVGQELSQRLDRFDGRGFQRVETVAVIDLGDGVEHRLALAHLGAEIVAEPLRGLGARSSRSLVLGHRPVFRLRALIRLIRARV